MKLEALFEKFDHFADASSAVAKMRELVLDLAVKGKLVRQDPNDEPAEELVARVAAEKRRLVQAREIKLETPLDPISDEEVFPIPKSWTWLRTGDLCRPISSGSTPDQSVFHPSEGIPYLKVYNIRNQAVDFDYKPQFIAKNYHEEKMKRSKLLPGDVIMNIVGPPLGKVAVVPDAFPEWNCNQAISFFRPIFPEFAPYLYTFLKEGSFLDNIQLIGTAGQDNISVTKCKFIPVPIPPLAEQRRIVAKVDELMALCDRLEAQQREREEQASKLARASLARFADSPTPENLNYLFHKSYTIPPADLRKSILTLAVQGKLVPQDPNDEPAQELVARVVDEKRRLVQAKEIKLETPLDPISDEEVFPIPKSWTWLRAGDLCRPISSGSTPNQSVFHPSEGIPYLKVYNIRNQAVDFDYKPQFVAMTYHEEKMKRSKLLPGDVIMNIVGPPLGKVAVVPDAFPEWNCNQAISFFRPIFPEFAPYLYTFLKEGSFLDNIQLIGTAGQDNISVTKCKFIPIPIPPLAEQRRIVAKVEQLMALVDELEQQLAASRATAANLLSALVDELTGTPSNGKVSVHAAITTGRRGRPAKS